MERAQIPSGQRYLSATQASCYLGLSRATLCTLRLAGDGPIFFKLGGGHIRYCRTSLDDWIRSHPGGGRTAEREAPRAAAGGVG